MATQKSMHTISGFDEFQLWLSNEIRKVDALLNECVEEGYHELIPDRQTERETLLDVQRKLLGTTCVVQMDELPTVNRCHNCQTKIEEALDPLQVLHATRTRWYCCRNCIGADVIRKIVEYNNVFWIEQNARERQKEK